MHSNTWKLCRTFCLHCYFAFFKESDVTKTHWYKCNWEPFEKYWLQQSNFVFSVFVIVCLPSSSTSSSCVDNYTNVSRSLAQHEAAIFSHLGALQSKLRKDSVIFLTTLRHLVIGAQVRGHVGGWMAWTGVDASSGWVPVRVRCTKEAGGCDGQCLGVRWHKVHFLSMGVVGAHIGQIRRVFVHGWLRRMRL